MSAQPEPVFLTEEAKVALEEAINDESSAEPDGEVDSFTLQMSVPDFLALLFGGLLEEEEEEEEEEIEGEEEEVEEDDITPEEFVNMVLEDYGEEKMDAIIDYYLGTVSDKTDTFMVIRNGGRAPLSVIPSKFVAHP